MAKAKTQDKEEVVETKEAVALPKMGDIVMFSKSKGTQTGNRLESYVAMVTGYPQDSNFQAKDLAINITIFGQKGNPIDTKDGVMYADKPTVGRWSVRA